MFTAENTDKISGRENAKIWDEVLYEPQKNCQIQFTSVCFLAIMLKLVKVCDTELYLCI